jgi:hypothetical protein
LINRSIEYVQVTTGRAPILRRVIRHSLKLMARDIHAVIRGASNTHAHLRDRLVAVSVVSIVVDLVASVAIFFLERHAHGTQIHTFGDAVFFTTTQLLTISSSVANPLSDGGKIIDLVLELYAITVVASVAGSFGAFFQRRGHERDAGVGPA